jgi:hypothetical protein
MEKEKRNEEMKNSKKILNILHDVFITLTVLNYVDILFFIVMKKELFILLIADKAIGVFLAIDFWTFVYLPILLVFIFIEFRGNKELFWNSINWHLAFILIHFVLAFILIAFMNADISLS